VAPPVVALLGIAAFGTLLFGVFPFIVLPLAQHSLALAAAP
jgi:hypothetical protein